MCVWLCNLRLESTSFATLNFKDPIIDVGSVTSSSNFAEVRVFEASVIDPHGPDDDSDLFGSSSSVTIAIVNGRDVIPSRWPLQLSPVRQHNTAAALGLGG